MAADLLSIRMSEQLISEVFNPALELVDSKEEEDDGDDVKRQVRAVNMTFGFMGSCLSNFITRLRILQHSNGMEQCWEAKLSKQLKDQIGLTNKLQDYRKIKEIAVSKEMLVFQNEQSVAEEFRASIAGLINSVKSPEGKDYV